MCVEVIVCNISVVFRHDVVCTATVQNNEAMEFGFELLLCYMSVCLSIRLHILETTRPNFAKFFVRVACGRV